MITAAETKWSDTQKMLIAITPKCSSLLSFVGSSYIIYHCSFPSSSDTSPLVLDHNKAGKGYKNSLYNRLLMALSFCDLISSLGWFLSTWPIPKDDDQNISIYNTIGSQKSCNLQGFILQFGSLGGALYNTCLSVYFCLLVRAKISGKKKNKKSRKRMEIMFHFISLVFPLLTATYGTLKGYMNPTPAICYVSEFPRGCTGEECTRGKNYKSFRLICLLLPIVLCFLIITISMIMLYRSVKKLEKKTLRNSTNTSISVKDKSVEKEKSKSSHFSISISSKNNIETIEPCERDVAFKEEEEKEHDEEESTASNALSNTQNLRKQNKTRLSQASKTVLRLAFRYIAAFLAVWAPILIQTLITKIFVNDVKLSFWSYQVSVLLGPLQGFHNALVFRGFNPLAFLFHILCYPYFLLFGKHFTCKTERRRNIDSWSYEYEFDYFIDDDLA